MPSILGISSALRLFACVYVCVCVSVSVGCGFLYFNNLEGEPSAFSLVNGGSVGLV